MKNALKVTLILFLLILIKLVVSFVLNFVVILQYNQGNYKKDLISVLKLLNTNEPYIVYYNEGNIFYHEEKYDEAISNYEAALMRNPPKSRVCDIRINMTLSMILKINFKGADYEILNDLAKARENLYQDHCADQEDASGESKEAEALEDAIRDLEDEIENPSSSSGDESGDNSSDDGESEETEEEKNIEQQLEEINKNAQASRGKDMEQSKNIGNYQFYDGKSW